jgi:uncharacterized protein (DUF1015 family)
LAEAKSSSPVYEFTSDFGGNTDLHGVANRVWKVPADSKLGQQIVAAVATTPLYIADGHHRYHAALKHGQTHFLTYITDEAQILAYNRVLRGPKSWAEVKAQFPAAVSVERFETPPKHHFQI